MDAEELAMRLEACLREIVPPGIIVTASHGSVGFATVEGQGFFGGRVRCEIENLLSFPTAEAPIEERALYAATRALDALQDFVDEETTDPWPGQRSVPRVNGEVSNGQILLFFGDRDDPVLRCPPIQIT